jgi:hypothetical protein
VNVATNDQKNQVIRADDVARAMVDVAVLGTGKRRGPIFENRDIQAIVESPPPPRRGIACPRGQAIALEEKFDSDNVS